MQSVNKNGIFYVVPIVNEGMSIKVLLRESNFGCLIAGRKVPHVEFDVD